MNHKLAILFFCFPTLFGQTLPRDVTALAASSPCPTQVQLQWKLPADYQAEQGTILVFVNKIPIQKQPEPKRTYEANADLAGSSLAQMDGAFCVFNGDDSSIGIDGLTPETRYYFSVSHVRKTSGKGSVSKGSSIDTTTAKPVSIKAFGKIKDQRVGMLEVKWSSRSECGSPYFVFGHAGGPGDCQDAVQDFRSVDIGALTPELSWSKRGETNDLFNFSSAKGPDNHNYVLFRGEIGVDTRIRVRGLSPAGGYHFHLYPSRWPFVVNGRDPRGRVLETTQFAGESARGSRPGDQADDPGTGGDRTLGTGQTDGTRPGSGQPGDGTRPGTSQPGDGTDPGTGQPGDGTDPGTGQPGDGTRPGSGQPGESTQPGTGQPGDGTDPGTGQPDGGTDPGKAGNTAVAGDQANADSLTAADEPGTDPATPTSGGQPGTGDDSASEQQGANKQTGNSGSRPLWWFFWIIILLFFFFLLVKRIRIKSKITFRLTKDLGNQKVKTWPPDSSLFALPEIEFLAVVDKGEQSIRETGIIDKT